MRNEHHKQFRRAKVIELWAGMLPKAGEQPNLRPAAPPVLGSGEPAGPEQRRPPARPTGLAGEANSKLASTLQASSKHKEAGEPEAPGRTWPEKCRSNVASQKKKNARKRAKTDYAAQKRKEYISEKADEADEPA